MKTLPPPELTPQDIERFWSHVKIGPDCWEWQGATWASGYGMFTIQRNKKRSRYRAHRIAYLITHGEFPPSGLACHTCDNPPCCRPDHVFDGTNADNMTDKTRKGRAATGANVAPRNPARGIRNKSTKLDEDAVREIRRLYIPVPPGKSSNAPELARRFGVSSSAIVLAAKGVTHRWLSPDLCSMQEDVLGPPESQ